MSELTYHAAQTSFAGQSVTTRAVELREGWVGQICVDETIVWQSPPTTPTTIYAGSGHRRSRAEAVEVAQKRVTAKLGDLFGAE